VGGIGMERPFIIYTLRRTGGTSLTSFMATISKFPSVEHEPFNRERRWGAISEAALQGQDRAALRRLIEEALALRPNIKHCVEVVPMTVTRELITLCAELGYAQFVLHRRQEKDRLMSLYLALATGAWGAKEAAEIYPRLRSGALQPLPMDLAKVGERVQTDAARMGETLMRLRAAGVDFGWLLFEEIYADPGATVAAALGIAGRMGLQLTDQDPRLSVFARTLGQGSGEVFDLVPQAAELKRVLDRLLG
jgi:hypothetical protein